VLSIQFKNPDIFRFLTPDLLGMYMVVPLSYLMAFRGAITPQREEVSFPDLSPHAPRISTDRRIFLSSSDLRLN